MSKIKIMKNGMRLGIMLIVLFILNPMNVQAKEGTVTFGSESYNTSENQIFPIGVYVKCEDNIGTYHVELQYDTKRMKYISGADGEHDGIITLEGTGADNEIKYMINFEATSGGTAGICVNSASINEASSMGGEQLTVTDLMRANITIAGNDVVGEPFWNYIEDDKLSELDVPVLDAVTDSNGTKLFIVNLAQYVPETVKWKCQTIQGKYSDIDVTFLTDNAQNISIIYLMDEQKNFYPYSFNTVAEKLYPIYDYTSGDGSIYIYTSPYAVGDKTEKLSEDYVTSHNIIYAIDSDGKGFWGCINQNSTITEVKDEERTKNETISRGDIILKLLLICLIILIAIIIIFYFYHKNRIQKIHEAKRKKRNELIENGVEIIPLNREIHEEQTVISVNDVTMNFRVSTSNASGIKEYLIQLLKHQVTYRKLTALNHISFDIFKGEVVGIIGTNGSGKSTLLKIVSGALRPTIGKVEVDHSKVQLLTLGTGFDMELSARENVYLNGAIIGYSKKFIDEHYQEIVDFAELDGFMEEKVKNFSSGMVSRLGFAVATVGEASEILILDEVLSVGDEFFRKKSLTRVKEMIHCGSTVLMVSHAMPTIIDNCTKVVWIEKGELRMIGEPKEVCKEYQKKNG